MSNSEGHIEIQQSAVIWKINNFSKQCKEKGEHITSPVFELGDLAIGSKWRLRLFPFGERRGSDGHLAVYLKFIPSDGIQDVKVECTWQFSILDNTGTLDLFSKEQSTTKMRYFKSAATLYGWKKFIERSDLLRKKSSLLKDDTLILSFSSKRKSWGKKEDNLGSSLANQYESLYLSKEFSDVTIVVNDKEIKAHKCILSNKSKVFSAMLKHDMEEGNTSIIKILDVDYEVMKEFLSFVYCGKIKNIKSFARSLLAASDKYDIVELKKMCEKSLWNDITVENACEILCIADLHNCIQLKSDIITYMVTNIKEVINTTTFDRLSISNPTLMNEVFHELVEQRIND